MTELYETKKPAYEKSNSNYDLHHSRDSIDYLLPEWVSVLKGYFMPKHLKNK
jgi:hypothetical protein